MVSLSNRYVYISKITYFIFQKTDNWLRNTCVYAICHVLHWRSESTTMCKERIYFFNKALIKNSSKTENSTHCKDVQVLSMMEPERANMIF